MTGLQSVPVEETVELGFADRFCELRRAVKTTARDCMIDVFCIQCRMPHSMPLGSGVLRSCRP